MMAFLAALRFVAGGVMLGLALARDPDHVLCDRESGIKASALKAAARTPDEEVLGGPWDRQEQWSYSDVISFGCSEYGDAPPPQRRDDGANIGARSHWGKRTP